MLVRPLRPLSREAARGVVDVAGAGQSDGDRDPAPGASQDGLGGRPRSPPRTRDCGPRGCACRASPGLPDLRQASVGATGVVEGVPTRFPRRAAPGAACCWGRSNRSRPELRARFLLSEQPCTIPPLRSGNFLGIGTMCALWSSFWGRASWVAFFFLLFFLFASRRLMFEKLDLCQKETAFLQRARLGALLESRVYLEQIW